MKRKVIIPPAIGDLLSLGGSAVKGLHNLSGSIDPKYSTEEVVRAILEAATQAHLDYQTAKSKRVEAMEAQDAANEKIYSVIMLARDVLKPKLGTRYSAAWNQAGFYNGKLSIPGTVSLRLPLARSLEEYFTAHPELQSPAVITAAMLAEARTDLEDSVAAANAARVTQRQLKALRDQAAAVLAKGLRALRKELSLLMADDDPRWIDFGFGVPADVHVTDAPQGLKLALTDGHVVASWDDTVNADRFRVSKRVVGVDVEYVPLDTTTDTSFDLGVFPAGAQVEVRVTAINSAGESVPSDVASVLVPSGG